MNRSQSGKMIAFFFLYIAQSIPMSFFSTAIPVVLRQENFSLASIGLLQLIKLPWILKFIWAPFIDARTRSEKDYFRWIISSELLYALLILAVSFLDITLHFPALFALVVLAFLASATQDIATDALAVLSFSKKEKSMAGSIQSMGGFAGTWIGSGLLLILFAKWGWTTLLYALSAFVLVALLPLIFRKSPLIVEPAPPKKIQWNDLFRFFARKGTVKLLLFLALSYSGLIGTLAMLKPMMVDLGYNMSKIGLMVGIIGTLAGCSGSFIGGFVMKRIARKTARIGGALYLMIAAFYIWIMSLSGFTTSTLYLGIVLIWSSYGAASVILYTTAMERVREGLEGTDFTLQTVIAHFSSMVVAIGSGKFADHFGYSGLFLAEFCLALVAFLFVTFVFHRTPEHTVA